MKADHNYWREEARQKGLNFPKSRGPDRPNPFAAAREHSKENGPAEITRDTYLGGNGTMKIRRYEEGKDVGSAFASKRQDKPDFAFRG